MITSPDGPGDQFTGTTAINVSATSAIRPMHSSWSSSDNPESSGVV
jgi:hypothetical protein